MLFISQETLRRLTMLPVICQQNRFITMTCHMTSVTWSVYQERSEQS